jgi:hypothetical protein
MALAARLSALNTYTALIERFFRWAPLALGTLGVGAISGWAASATTALAAYSPLSWLGSGLLGVLLSAAVCWLWNNAKLRYEQSKNFEEMRTRTKWVNPLENVFIKQRIDIDIFKRPAPGTARGKTFVECDIYGPATIIVNGYTNLERASFGFCDFVEVMVNSPIYNAISFTDTTFRGCRFYYLTLLIPTYLAGTFPRDMGANWITPIVGERTDA